MWYKLLSIFCFPGTCFMDSWYLPNGFLRAMDGRSEGVRSIQALFRNLTSFISSQLTKIDRYYSYHFTDQRIKEIRQVSPRILSCLLRDGAPEVFMVTSKDVLWNLAKTHSQPTKLVNLSYRQIRNDPAHCLFQPPNMQRFCH